MKLTHLALAAALAGVSFGAQAGPNWNYVEAGFVRLNSDSLDGDGFGMRGSVAVAESWHLFARFDNGSGDVGRNSFDFNSFSVGAGYNFGINDSTDFVARLAYERAEVEVFRSSGSADGYSVFAGVRSQLSDNFTLGAGVAFFDGDEDSSTALQLEAQYAFTPSIAVSLAIEGDDDGQTFFIGPRLNF